MKDWNIRRLEPTEETLYRDLVTEFYATDGADHPIPAAYIQASFQELCRSEDYLVCYVIQWQGQVAGYVLLAKMWSQEAGGLCLWLEELYLRPQFRGNGLGDRVLTWLRDTWQGTAARWRLEVVPSHDRVKALYARYGYEAMPYDQMVLETPIL